LIVLVYPLVLLLLGLPFYVWQLRETLIATA